MDGQAAPVPPEGAAVGSGHAWPPAKTWGKAAWPDDASPRSPAATKGDAASRRLRSVATPLREPRTPRCSEGQPCQDQQEAAEHLQGNFEQMMSQLEDCMPLLGKLSGAASEVSIVRKECEDLRSQLRSGEGLLRERGRQLAEAQAEAQEQRRLAEHLGGEAEALRASLGEAEERSAEQHRAVVSEQTVSLARAATIEELSGKLAAADRDLADCAAQREEAAARLAAALPACEAAERRAAEAEEKLAAERLEREQLSEAFRELQSAQAAGQQDLAEVELACARQVGELSQRGAELEALRLEMERLEEQLHASEALRADAEQRAQRVPSYEEKLAAEQDRRDQLTTQLAEWEEMLDQARSEASQERLAREREVQALRSKASQAQAALQELERSRATVAQQQEEITELESLVCELRTQSERDQEGAWLQQRATEQKVASLTGSLEEAGSALQRLQAQLEGTMDECAREQAAMRQMVDERVVQLQSKEEEVVRLRENLETTKREHAREQLASGLPEQNRELSLTLRQFTHDLELAESENRSLREAVALFEEDLERVTGQSAQAAGHMNHKQKIRYTLRLKEEINRLFAELRKARQRIVQLEVSREGEGLLDALASVGALMSGGPRASAATSPPRVPSPSPPRASAAPRAGGRASAPAPRRLAASFTPSRSSPRRRSPPASSPPRTSRSPGAPRPDDQAVRLHEAERRCRAQEQALERISIDFQHLRVLIERLVMVADSEPAGCDAAAPPAGSFSALLQRLRGLCAEAHARRGPAALEVGDGALPARELFGTSPGRGRQ